MNTAYIWAMDASPGLSDPQPCKLQNSPAVSTASGMMSQLPFCWVPMRAAVKCDWRRAMERTRQ